MIRAGTETSGRRPSLQLPEDLFGAILELEQLARIVGRRSMVAELGVDYVETVVAAGAARDRLAALILERLNGVQETPSTQAI